MMINYHGKDTSAREIADKYRGGFPSISAREVTYQSPSYVKIEN